MKLNINEKKMLQFFLENQIKLEDIDYLDRKDFINNNGVIILHEAFKNKNFEQLELLLENKQIKNLFIKEITLFTSLAELNFIAKLPENNIISIFILEMNRQNFEYKKDFFEKIVNFILEYKEEMKSFFAIKTGEALPSFPKGQPIGLCILRVINDNIEVLIKEKIIPISLYNSIIKDTMAHSLYQYSFENNKVIINNLENLDNSLKDKNIDGKTPLDNLMNDLREKNINTIEYLFSEKLDIAQYKNELINYIIKCSNILRNKQSKDSLKDRVFKSLDKIFNLEELQSNLILKETIAKAISQKSLKEVQYLWLSAKLPAKNILNKMSKI